MWIEPTAISFQGMHTCMYTHIHTFTHAHTHVHTHMHKHAHTQKHTHALCIASSWETDCRADISKSRRYPGKHLCRYHGHNGLEKGELGGLAKSPRIWDSLYCCTVITYFIWNYYPHNDNCMTTFNAFNGCVISQLHMTFFPSLFNLPPSPPTLAIRSTPLGHPSDCRD